MKVDRIDLPSIINRIKKNVGFLLGASGIATVFGFATVALNARALGADGLGIIALFQASAAILNGVFNVGSQQPMIRLGRQAIEDQQNERLGAIAGLAICLDLALACMAGLSAWGIVWFFPKLIGLSEDLQRLAFIYSIVIFFSATSTSMGLFRLLNRFHYIGILQVCNALLIFLLSLIFFFVDAELPAYIVAYTIIQSLTSVSYLLLGIKLLKDNSIALHFNLTTIRRVNILRDYFSYAWTTAATSAINTVRANADTVILNMFFGLTFVGVYSVVKQVAGVFNKLSNAVYSSVFPEISALKAKQNYSDALVLMNRLAFAAVGIGLVFVIMALFFGKILLKFGFGDDFVVGGYPLALLFTAVTISLSAGILTMFVQVFISPEKLFSLFLISFILYAIGAPLVIKFFGLIGAPIAQVIFSLSLWVGCWLVLHKLYPFPSKENTRSI